MADDIDITDKVFFGEIDDECTYILKCVCGAKFPHWEFIISIYEGDPYKCPKCGLGIYFKTKTTIYQKSD